MAAPALACRVLARLSTALQPADDPAGPTEMARRGARIARAHRRRSGAILDVLDLAGLGATTRPPPSGSPGPRSCGIARWRPSDVAKALTAWTWLAYWHIESGDFPAFERAAASALELSARVGHPRFRWGPLLLASGRALALGRFDESDRYLTEVSHIAALIDDPALALSLVDPRDRSGQAAAQAGRAAPGPGQARRRDRRGQAQGGVRGGCSRAGCLAYLEDAEATRAALAGVDLDLGHARTGPDILALAGRGARAGGQRRAAPADPSLPRAGRGRGGVRRRTLLHLRGHGGTGDGPARRRAGRPARRRGPAARRPGARPGPAVTPRGSRSSRTSWRRCCGRAGRDGRGQRADRGGAALAARAGHRGRRHGPPEAVASAEATRGAAPAFRLAAARRRSGPSTARAATARVKDSRGMRAAGPTGANGRARRSTCWRWPATQGASRPREQRRARCWTNRPAPPTAAGWPRSTSELEEAEAAGDAAAARRLSQEKQAIAGELARAIGLGGRARLAGSATERARINVQRRLKVAIQQVAEVDASLGRFLEQAVRTGTYCCFRG